MMFSILFSKFTDTELLRMISVKKSIKNFKKSQIRTKASSRSERIQTLGNYMVKTPQFQISLKRQDTSFVVICNQ